MVTMPTEPAVSVGNLAQLSADLLISTLELTRAGYLHDASILPLCGHDPFGRAGMTEGCLVTSTEVYESKQRRLVVVQQRTPLVKGKHEDFRRKLLAWIKDAKFSKVILLTSSQSHERIDAQLTGSQFRYLTTPKLEEQLGTVLSEQLHWKKLEKRKNQWAPPFSNEEGRPEYARGIYIPGGGIAKKLFEDCCSQDIPLAVLLLFCSEGDNIPDALSMVSHLNQWLQLVQEPESSQQRIRSPWKIPSSWSMLYGPKFEPSIY
ncbi:proteasome assembly chaperone 2-like isoform X2 [Acanthaster planci]|uniref:Proteasome assembly chaperone 2 n=1 Tax=Acanthaster planci TaxID=133434 RepID=A0A8B7YFV5_ACAPL|nr:proteasome assembly chaperone 2-like isoform X2 [Acanthaster planci]